MSARQVTPEQPFQEPAGSEGQLPLLRVVDAAELLSMTFEPRDYVLHPILPTQGTAMLYGPRGCGKTLMTLGASCAIAAGGRFLKWTAPKPRKVVYVDGEMPAVTMRDRLASIIASMEEEIQPEFFRLITPDLQPCGIPSLSTTMGQTMIEDQLKDAELLILDNISTLCRGGKENEAESWLPVQEWVLDLRRRGVSVLFDHHANRTGGQRGTSRREDVLDTVIALRKPDDYSPSEGLRVEIHFEKARNIHGPDLDPFEVRMETRDGAVVWLTNTLSNVTQAKALTLFDDGLSVRDVAKELKISKSQAQRLKAVKKGGQ